MNLEALRELASKHSIATEFWDWQGSRREIPDQTLIHVLTSLGMAASDDEEVANSLQEFEQQHWRRVLPPTIVTREGWTPWVAVHVPHGSQVSLVAKLEDGSYRQLTQVDQWVEPREIDGTLIGEATFSLPGDLPIGWHQAVASSGGKEIATATLIVTPQRLDLPPDLDKPVWGLMEQLYQIRSEQSWGIGDLVDLATTVEWAGKQGADFCLINPIHAAAPRLPMEPSPYLPTSRRFANPIYLSVPHIKGYDALPQASREAASDLARRDSGDGTLDRDRVWLAKEPILREIFIGSDANRDQGFLDFCAREGKALLDFATWCALDEQAAEDGFPDDCGSPDSAGTKAFREQHPELVDFHRWLQWQLEIQHANAHRTALDSGMSIGLIADLAVGVHPGGADAWSLQHCLAGDVHVGAPPDQFNQLGQDWHQPPWHPGRLVELGYAPYRDLVRATLRNCGALRIDHIIGLFRLWWIPADATPDQGTYVYYDHEALIGILLLEAKRAGVMVIGEDLGVVEPSARDHLAERGVLGTSILWFEWRDGEPLPPEDYRRLCLSTVTTHDLPPTAGYLDLIHVRIREELGLLTRPVAEEEAAEKESIDKVRRALTQRGLLREGASVEEEVRALYAWLRQTPSLLHGVALADLVGDRRPINQPGTSDEYPNWRLPLADHLGNEVSLEELTSPTSSPELLRLWSEGPAN
jgi:4-alpha-glucanotransferase